MKIKNIVLGRPVAEYDQMLESCFVPISICDDLLVDLHLGIIVGRKGSGKSALCENLEKDGTARIVNANAIHEVKQNYDAAKNIGPDVAMNLMTAAWSELILIEAMEEVMSESKRFLNRFVWGDVGTITKYVRARKNESDSSGATFMAIVSQLVKLISEGALAAGVEIATGADKAMGRQRDMAINALSRLITKRKKPVIIIVDNIDKTWEKLSGNEWELMRGLIWACIEYGELKNPLREKIIAKCCLPTRPFLEMPSAHHDKISACVVNLTWNKTELLEFITTRLRKYLPDDSDELAPREIWHAFFPPEIFNDATRENEHSFKYVLRHTFYRPRDLLIIWEKIRQTAGDETKLSATIVRRGVAAGVKALYKSVLGENQPVHGKFLKKIVGAFAGGSNRILAPDFDSQLETRLNNLHETQGFESPDLRDTKKLLWDLGFFGVLHEPEELSYRKVYGDGPHASTQPNASLASSTSSSSPSSSLASSTSSSSPSSSWSSHGSSRPLIVFSFVNDQYPFEDAEDYVIHPAFYESLNIRADSRYTVSPNPD